MRVIRPFFALVQNGRSADVYLLEKELIMPLTILGNVHIPHQEFVEKIDKACILLRDKAGVRYGYMYSHVKQITAHRASGADVIGKNIHIARATFDASLTWLASVLIHESIHIWQKEQGQPFNGVPAEQACNAVQLEVLQAINAPVSELNHMRAQTGDHADLDGDGDYDWDDYRLRNY